MGNYKFRLSDMMPNAWFYKLKDMGKPRSHTTSSPSQHHTKKKPLSPTQPSFYHQQPQFTNHRHSYYITTEPINRSDKLYNSPIHPKSTDVHFPDPSRKSSRRRRRRKRSIKSLSSTKLVTSSVSAGCNCRATLDSVWTKSDSSPDYSAPASRYATSPEPTFEECVLPEFESDELDVLHSWSSSCSCRVSSSATDIIIDMESRISSNSTQTFEKFDGLDSISPLDLPPILTKPAKFNDMVSDIKRRDNGPVKCGRGSVKLEEKMVTEYISVKEETIKARKEHKLSPPIRRITPNSPGLKLRLNSPRIASKKMQAYSRKTIYPTTRRKNLSDSFAIVKSSFDPQTDFRESMLEMIVENNIRASKDLEELLACYLTLNSNEYHDIIVKVFEQIWFDLTDIQL